MSINLLPWRKQEAKKKLRRLSLLIAALLIASLTMSLIFYFKQGHYQHSQKILLLSLKKQFTTTSMLAAKNAPEHYKTLRSVLTKISELKKSRASLGEKLWVIIEKTPRGISLTHLSITEKQTILEGFSAHKTALEAFMEKLSGLFKRERFSAIVNEDAEKIQFKMMISPKRKP